MAGGIISASMRRPAGSTCRERPTCRSSIWTREPSSATSPRSAPRAARCGPRARPEPGLHLGRPGQLRHRVRHDDSEGRRDDQRREGTPDAILYDPASKHVLSMNHSGGDITVIDPAALDKTVTIQIGGTLEYAVADGLGTSSCASRTRMKSSRSTPGRIPCWPAGAWASAKPPTGLDIDVKGHRPRRLRQSGR